jgi:cytochrome c biogenesis protein
MTELRVPPGPGRQDAAAGQRSVSGENAVTSMDAGEGRGAAVTSAEADGGAASGGDHVADGVHAVGHGEAAQAPAAASTSAGQRPSLGARNAVLGWLRWMWRQLTSMRTALVLLFLLAVASVPGSVIPQQGIDPAAVARYYAAHPALAPVLARLSLFNVFAAPWFAAIYLLLFLSLAGCVLPRTFRLAGSARQRPPPAPRNLARLPQAASHRTALAPAEALESAAGVLSGKRFRLREGAGWVAAEKGYLREVGNLLFHIALLALLGSVGIGGIFGYKADRLLISGQSFANTPTALDQFRPGRLVSPSDLQPFSIMLDNFTASYVSSGLLRGQPSSFNASVSYADRPGAPLRRGVIQVNHPLNVDGVQVFLVGHGYAPVFRITDGAGRVVFDGAVPFIPVEQAGLTSEGVIKVPDADPEQLGFAGVFLPTAVDVNGRLRSAFPAALLPRVSLLSYAGNLGTDTGPSQSVYQLDTAHLRRLPLAPRPLAPGQSMKLPGHAGTLTFTGYRQWASLAITYDPGQLPALISGIVAIAGLLLSFAVRRRRVFVRAHAGPDGGAVVEVGGLARSDVAGGFEEEFASLAAEIRESGGGTQLSGAAGYAGDEHAGDGAAAAGDGAAAPCHDAAAPGNDAAAPGNDAAAPCHDSAAHRARGSAGSGSAGSGSAGSGSAGSGSAGSGSAGSGSADNEPSLVHDQGE